MSKYISLSFKPSSPQSTSCLEGCGRTPARFLSGSGRSTGNCIFKSSAALSNVRPFLRTGPSQLQTKYIRFLYNERLCGVADFTPVLAGADAFPEEYSVLANLETKEFGQQLTSPQTVPVILSPMKPSALVPAVLALSIVPS